MPHVFGRFYPKATGWLYEYDPGTLNPAGARLPESDLAPPE